MNETVAKVYRRVALSYTPERGATGRDAAFWPARFAIRFRAVRRKLGSVLGGIVAAAAWYALALQLSILLRTSTDWVHTFLNFLGSFTILTNILVALVLTAPTLPVTGTRRFGTPTARTAATVYIAIIGFVDVVVLQEPWSPRGAQALADLILHKVVSILYVAYWVIFEPHGRVRWRAAVTWLFYPAVYLVYSLARGAVTGWYPYAFLDASRTGYARVVVESSVMLVVFLLMSVLVIAADRTLATWTRRASGASAELRGASD
jgi:hypothetical protein